MSRYFNIHTCVLISMFLCTGYTPKEISGLLTAYPCMSRVPDKFELLPDKAGREIGRIAVKEYLKRNLNAAREALQLVCAASFTGMDFGLQRDDPWYAPHDAYGHYMDFIDACFFQNALHRCPGAVWPEEFTEQRYLCPVPEPGKGGEVND